MLQTNYYLNFLPKYNPAPIMIFNGKGNVGFQNDAAKRALPHVKTLNDLGKQNYINIQSFEYKCDDKTYQVYIQYIAKIDIFIMYVADISELIDLKNEIKRTQIEIVDLMGTIGETRSQETGNHVKRVAEYSKLMAIKLGLSEKEAEMIRVASPMHDIGKVGIPDAILNKPGKLTDEEFTQMKKHVEIGYNLLKNSKRAILKVASIVAHEHHEKYDGTGYPRGLRADQIHIYGRITAFADVFDALCSDRVYKKAWPLEKVLDYFKEERGKQFDPLIVDLFFKHLEEFLVIRDRYQDIDHGSNLKSMLHSMFDEYQKAEIS